MSEDEVTTTELDESAPGRQRLTRRSEVRSARARFVEHLEHRSGDEGTVELQRVEHTDEDGHTIIEESVYEERPDGTRERLIRARVGEGRWVYSKEQP